MVSDIIVKKTFSIALIFLFLFNAIGHFGIYLAMQQRSEAKLNQQIENDQYKKELAFTIKIPLTLPYPLQHNNFERVEGEFEYHGEFYKLVKQKHSTDTLYIVCIKNVEQKKAFKVFSDMVKLSLDQSSTTKNQNTKSLINLMKDFNPTINKFEFADLIGTELSRPFYFLKADILNQAFAIFSPPPEA